MNRAIVPDFDDAACFAHLVECSKRFLVGELLETPVHLGPLDAHYRTDAYDIVLDDHVISLR